MFSVLGLTAQLLMMLEQVAADRNHEGESPEELQKKTAGHAEEKHK
jgi:hypothetical protein